MKRIALLLAVGLLTGGASANSSLATGSAADNPAIGGKHKPHTYTEQLQPQPSASQAGGQAVRDAAALPPARLQERADLLKRGEAALARLDVAGALNAFERATLILHAADTEIALVRSYMQAGDYRRALGFGAHTAGAHLDVTGGSLLYAWLLHVGGQPAVAQRLLADSGAHLPDNPALQAVRQQLRSGAPFAAGPLLELPTRLAPYGDRKGLPDTARVVGSAVLLPGGAQALVPLSLLPRSRRLWLRNGLGQLVKATPDWRPVTAGVALVRLERPLPAVKELVMATSDAFPGSAGFAVEYVVASPDAAPAWPVLRTGFLGSASGDSGARLLGIDMPAGPRGGPVFDGAGRFIGLALQQGAGKGGDRLVPVSQMKQAFDGALAAKPTAQNSSATAGLIPRSPVDKIYEDSLKTCLQVITAP